MNEQLIQLRDILSVMKQKVEDEIQEYENKSEDIKKAYLLQHDVQQNRKKITPVQKQRMAEQTRADQKQRRLDVIHGKK